MEILAILEAEQAALSDVDRARYAYLRGMTEFRLRHSADARHWLALALAFDQLYPGTLQEAWQNRASAALEELNASVFEGVRRRRL